jgi:hypothetical protein
LSTYAELSSALQAALENDFPESVGDTPMTSAEQIALFFTNAELRIQNAVQLPVSRKTGTVATVANTSTVATPADWLSSYSIALITPVTLAYNFLLNKDVEYIREAYPAVLSTGTPLYYALQDNDTLLLGPTPDAVYTLSLNYYYYPESITTAGTSWLGDTFPNVLLYAAMIEGYTFMKGEADVLAQYEKIYSDGLDELKQFAEGMNRQDTYRTQQVRYPVR